MALRACVFLFVAASAACGGTAVLPAPTLAPHYPSVIGRYRGGVDIVVHSPARGVTWREACSVTMWVDAQHGAAFSGSFTSPGSGPDSDRRCERGGRFSGTVTRSGVVSGLTFQSVWGYMAFCTRMSEPITFSGVIGDDGVSLSAEGADVWSCPPDGARYSRWTCLTGLTPGPPLECDRRLSFAVRRS
jgi:hypothetical protein